MNDQWEDSDLAPPPAHLNGLAGEDTGFKWSGMSDAAVARSTLMSCEYVIWVDTYVALAGGVQLATTIPFHPLIAHNHDTRTRPAARPRVEGRCKDLLVDSY